MQIKANNFCMTTWVKYFLSFVFFSLNICKFNFFFDSMRATERDRDKKEFEMLKLNLFHWKYHCPYVNSLKLTFAWHLIMIKKKMLAYFCRWNQLFSMTMNQYFYSIYWLLLAFQFQFHFIYDAMLYQFNISKQNDIISTEEMNHSDDSMASFSIIFDIFIWIFENIFL